MTSDLITRLEKAEGGSRELDAEIMCLVGGARRVDDFTFHGPNEAVWCLWDGLYDPPSIPELPYVTTSLDAALALAERLGWQLRSLDHSIPNQPSVMLQGPIKHYPAEGDHPAHDGPAYQCGRGKTRPLATCIAILRALKGTDNG